MKVWLDDIRSAPEGWVHVKTAEEVIELLQKGVVEEVSLDHDLGENLTTGYAVACFIEREAHSGSLKPLICAVHSANPVGARRMRQALKNADKFWQQ